MVGEPFCSKYHCSPGRSYSTSTEVPVFIPPIGPSSAVMRDMKW